MLQKTLVGIILKINNELLENNGFIMDFLNDYIVFGR